MNRRMRELGWRGAALAVLVAALALGLGQTAGAATASLQLANLAVSPVGTGAGVSPMDRMADSMARGVIVRITVDDEGTPVADPQFKTVVKNEPSGLACKNPLRGVVQVGEKQYGFIFDSTDPSVVGYNRMYFDRNGNGDLSDDGMITALPPSRRSAAGRESLLGTLLLGASTVRPATTARLAAASRVAASTRVATTAYFYNSFPGVDVSVAAGGKTFDYRLFSRISSTHQKEGGRLNYASATFKSGTYRKGEIELDGKPLPVVLIDANGNGRFGDPLTFKAAGAGPGARVRPVYGDALVVDPEKAATARLFYLTLRPGCHVTPLYQVGDKTYKLTVSAAGDSVALEPADGGVGKVKCPGRKFTGVLYSDSGFVALEAKNGAAVDVPAGQWKLYQYTIDMATEAPKPQTSQTMPEMIAMRSTATTVSAAGTGDSQSFKVEKGQTVVLPFGGPYRTLVVAAPDTPPKGAQAGAYAKFNLSLVGKGNEAITSLMVNGKRPAAPTFLLADSKGKKVGNGAFEFG